MQKVVIMTEQEAKQILREDPKGDTIKRLEAMEKAIEILGENCKMTEFWKWLDEETVCVDDGHI